MGLEKIKCMMTPEKIQSGLTLLKQPSTIKGLLGLLMLLGWKVSPEEYSDVVEGLWVVYCLIAVFWQKS